MVIEWFAIAIAKSEGLWQSIDLTLVFFSVFTVTV
jgi:hypothetical protein